MMQISFVLLYAVSWIRRFLEEGTGSDIYDICCTSGLEMIVVQMQMQPTTNVGTYKYRHIYTKARQQARKVVGLYIEETVRDSG